ncbi:MAG: hypothetical protein AAGA72_05250 [Pseudomonadota bacterium]
MSGDFEFNDELCLTKKDQSKLKREFPNVAFALHTVELAEPFKKIDAEAKEKKSRFRRFGMFAIALAWIALTAAAVEAAIVLPNKAAGVIPQSAANVIAIAAAAAGIFSVVIGWAGMGISNRKRDWLKSRLIAERYRQWQWQYLLTHIDAAIAATIGSEDDRHAYVTQRAEVFRSTSEDLLNNSGALLAEQLGTDTSLDTKLWLDRSADIKIDNILTHYATQSSPPEKEALEELFRGYTSIRFRSQSRYTAWILGDVRFWMHPRTQQRKLHAVGEFCVAVIVILHVALLSGVLFQISELHSPVIYLLALDFAVSALAARAIEDGLGPAEQIARLKAYLNAIETARLRFAAGDVADKIREAVQMENAAAREMNEFLTAANSKRYVM